MSKTLMSYFVACVILSILVLFPMTVSAENNNLSLRLWGQFSPFISGDAGSGPGAPDYTDAFNNGVGIGGELSWRLSDRFSCLTGIGYEAYDGDTHEDISFDDLEIVSFYIGGKYHLTKNAQGLDPYLRMDIGAARLSSVEVSYESLKGEYWDSSRVFLFDFGGGTEYRWGQWGASFDIKVRYLGKPDSDLGDPSKADSFWTVPVVFGINYYFR